MPEIEGFGFVKSWFANKNDADEFDDESGPSSEGEEACGEGGEGEEDALGNDFRTNPQEWTALQPDKVRLNDRFSARGGCDRRRQVHFPLPS